MPGWPATPRMAAIRRAPWRFSLGSPLICSALGSRTLILSSGLPLIYQWVTSSLLCRPRPWSCLSPNGYFPGRRCGTEQISRSCRNKDQRTVWMVIETLLFQGWTVLVEAVWPVTILTSPRTATSFSSNSSFRSSGGWPASGTAFRKDEAE